MTATSIGEGVVNVTPFVLGGYANPLAAKGNAYLCEHGSGANFNSTDVVLFASLFVVIYKL